MTSWNSVAAVVAETARHRWKRDFPWRRRGLRPTANCRPFNARRAAPCIDASIYFCFLEEDMGRWEISTEPPPIEDRSGLARCIPFGLVGPTEFEPRWGERRMTPRRRTASGWFVASGLWTSLKKLRDPNLWSPSRRREDKRTRLWTLRWVFQSTFSIHH